MTLNVTVDSRLSVVSWRSAEGPRQSLNSPTSAVGGSTHINVAWRVDNVIIEWTFSSNYSNNEQKEVSEWEKEEIVHSSPNIDPFEKFFHLHTFQKICNNQITTTP